MVRETPGTPTHVHTYTHTMKVGYSEWLENKRGVVQARFMST